MEHIVRDIQLPLRAVLDTETELRLFRNLSDVLEVTTHLNERLEVNPSPTAYAEEFSKIAPRYEEVLLEYWRHCHVGESTRSALMARNKKFKSKYVEIISALPDSTVALFGGHRDLLANFLNLPTKRPPLVEMLFKDLRNLSSTEDPARAKWSDVAITMGQLLERVNSKCIRATQKGFLRNLFRAGNESGGDFSQAGEDEYLLALVARDQENSFPQAIAHFESASGKGHLEAKMELGKIYHLGLGGTPVDIDKALSYYEAAAATFPDAGCSAGQIYFEKGDQDFALALLKEAFEGGHVEAGYIAAQVCKSLNPPEDNEALAFLTEASLRGSVKAREAVIAHFTNNGTPEKAVDHLSQYLIKWPSDKVAKAELKATLSLY